MTNEVTIELRRTDSNDNPALIGLARQGAESFGYKADLSIDRQLAQLLRLRVAQINNCTYCLNLHYEAARDLGTPRPKIDTLSAWWETNLFTAEEQAALNYTEMLTRIADTTNEASFQDTHDVLAKHFSKGQVLDIIGIIINMNIWTRLKLAEGATPTPS